MPFITRLSILAKLFFSPCSAEIDCPKLFLSSLFLLSLFEVLVITHCHLLSFGLFSVTMVVMVNFGRGHGEYFFLFP